MPAPTRTGPPATVAPTVTVTGATVTVSVAAAVVDGEPVPLFVARPYREDGPAGWTVEAADPLLRRPDVVAAVHAAHQALGARGLTVTKVRLCGWGPNRRVAPAALDTLAEDHPALYLAGLATGLDLAAVRADLAAGRRPPLAARRRCAAALLHLRPAPGRAGPAASALPPGIWETALVAAGDEGGGPLLRAVSVGEDTAACLRALDALAAALRRPYPTIR